MIGLLLLLVVLGAALWTVEASIQMAPGYKNAIRVVVALILFWYALGLLGFAPPFPRYPRP